LILILTSSPISSLSIFFPSLFFFPTIFFSTTVSTEEKAVSTEKKLKRPVYYVSIALNDPDMAAEFNELIQSIYLFNGKAIIGGTLSSCLGAMSISLPDLSIPSTATKFGYDAYFLEHFVHELSHNLLNVIMSVDKVVLNSMDESFKAPLRTDLRHMYGVFHAAFVVSRMIRVFRALDAKGHVKFGGLVSHFQPRLQSGLNVIREYGKLSKAGEMVFDSLESTAGLA
jgi:HEXXH motif-containing protein